MVLDLIYFTWLKFPNKNITRPTRWVNFGSTFPWNTSRIFSKKCLAIVVVHISGAKSLYIAKLIFVPQLLHMLKFFCCYCCFSIITDKSVLSFTYWMTIVGLVSSSWNYLDKLFTSCIINSNNMLKSVGEMRQPWETTTRLSTKSVNHQ